MRKHKTIAIVSALTAFASLVAFHKLATTGIEMLACITLFVASIALISRMLYEIEEKL